MRHLTTTSRTHGACALVIALAACIGCSSTASPLDGDVDAQDAGFTDAPPTLLELTARTCVLMAQCNAPVSVASCARQYLTMTYPDRGRATREMATRLIHCGEATNCAAFLSCQIGGRPASYCSEHSGASCDGDTLIFCGSAYNLALPCASYGIACRSIGTTAVCASNDACVTATHTAECVGNRLVYCTADPGTPSGLDCSLGVEGGVCVASGGNATCASPTLCALASTQPRCDGNVAASCANGHDRRIDCTVANGGRCVVPADVGSHMLEDLCIPSDAVCDAATARDRCRGTSVEGCVSGQWIAVDCRTIGFANCQDTSTGARCIR